MSQEVSPETFEMGQIIFREGDVQSHFYIIEEGRVGIFVMQNGKNVRVSEIGPGESFGEFALLDKAPRSASAQALTQVKAFRVSEKGFDELMAQLPDWAACMLRNFVQRLKAMNQKTK